MSERIRVFRVIARLNVGGPAIHATLLTERLAAAGYETMLVAGREAPEEGNYLRLHGRSLAGLTVVPELGREVRPAADLRALLRMVRLMREFRPQVVHTHTAKAGTLGRIAASVVGVPVVVHTYHGHVFHGYFSPLMTKFFLAVERWLGRRTDRLLAVSATVRDELLRLGVGRPRTFSVVPLGLDLQGFLDCEPLRGQLRAELGVPLATPLVGIVARLAPIKRHEWFLEAAARVAEKVPLCRFLVVGDGERRAELERVAAGLGLGGRVCFLGWRPDLERIYADLDVAALTSANEGSPVSLIEAMAAGKAVVATRVGGVPDLVEDGVSGVLVPPADPRALACAMERLLGDPERRRAMGRAGRRRVFPALSAQRLVEDMDRLYRDLLFNKVQT